LTRGDLEEAAMTHWHDSMVDRPETDDSAYATGWTVSGLAVLGAIVAVWVFGI
jgi:hypothetical protein